MTISKEDVLRGEPINGHILIAVDVDEILGKSKDSVIQIVESVEQKYAASASRGVIVKMASDAFGSKYKEKYGSEINPPQIGDTVHFVPYQSNKMDNEGEYYLITDDGVKFIERKKS